VIAVLGGLGASISFAVSALCGAAASRRIGAASTLAWVMTIGLVVILPGVLFADTGQLSAARITLLVIAGVTNVAGLLLEYVAFRRGKIGVITPIVSTEGAVATGIAVIAGLQLSPQTAVPLLLVSVGVILATAHPDPPDLRRHTTGVRSAILAIPVAVLFGISLYVTARVGRQVSVLWVLLPGRLVGTGLIAAPLAVRGNLQPPRSAWPLVLAGAVAEVLGIVSYTLGARHQIAIAAVIASQFAALAAVGAYFLFDERLSKLQLAGLVVVAFSVGLLAADST
jgi:drug/metabolite transporter (DMT)-like permease